MRAFSGSLLLVLLALVLSAVACSESEVPVFIETPPDAGTPLPARTSDASNDPPPRPIDETPKPPDPDKAPAPVASSIAPNKGTAGAVGPSFVLKGTGFAPRSVVHVDGVALTTTFKSATELHATLPTAKLATVATLKVTVVTAAPGGGASAAVAFAVENPAPELTALAPLSVLTGAAATVLTLEGTSFVNGSTVLFGTTELTATLKSPTELETTVPGNLFAMSRSVPVKVVNPAPGGGTSSEIAFSITNPAASVSSISPTSAKAKGSAFDLTVRGAGFVNGSTILFNGVSLPTSLSASDELHAQVPRTSIALPGEFPVTVMNPPPGGGVSAPAAFTVTYPVPTVEALPGVKLPAGSGPTEVTISGLNFFPSSVITFAEAPAATTYADSGHLKATLTAAQLANAGTIAARVVNPAPGGGTSSASKTITVTNDIPAITALNPSSVSSGSPDTVVTIHGSNFVATSTVRSKGNLVPSTYVDGGQLKATIPAADLAAAGTTVAIIVVNPTPGGGSSGVARLVVACQDTEVNVPLTDLTTTHTLLLDFPSAPALSRWGAGGGTCPEVPLFSAILEPARYATVQNRTTNDVTLSAWAACADDGKGDAYLTISRRATSPDADDEQRKACTGVVAQGGTKYRSPESGGSAHCPGLTKANTGGIKLAACERAVVHIQTFRASSSAYGVPLGLKVRAE